MNWKRGGPERTLEVKCFFTDEGASPNSRLRVTEVTRHNGKWVERDLVRSVHVSDGMLRMARQVEGQPVLEKDGRHYLVG